MDIQQAVTELESQDLKFPRQALEWAIANRDVTIPKLIAMLERTVQDPQFSAENQKYMGHIYAMYLLAQFREKTAYPLIVELTSLAGEMTDRMIGDTLTEGLPRILAGVSCGDDYLIRRLVENEDANEFVRDAALRALVTLVTAGEKSRDEVISYFQSLFRTKLPRKDSLIWSSLVSCSLDLYPGEVYRDIMQCYEEDLVDPEFVDEEDVEETMAKGKEAALQDLLRNPHFILITDAIEAMEWWALFKPPKPLGGDKKTKRRKKLGRNDPCPCGSGKKYKKCCGNIQ
jgi:Protein of unknown function (DUF1186)/SEC-C motif